MSPHSAPPPADHPDPALPWDLRPTKLQPGHYDRLAVVYVRQSTPQQVLDHQESARLQYGLAARARGLGWAADRVLVIDDDQGTSGASRDGRLGFQRLVTEVSLGHVGLILGGEVSRLARSCADWYQLLELCALFGALIADLDGIYDPADYNDRLLLGLKGTMSEAELHILKQRMHQGRLSKARRGELALPLPIGYVRRPSGEVVLDPDEQVQHVVRLIFRKFEEVGTVNGLLRYLVDHQVQVGVRVREGPATGELEWRRPNRVMLQNLLRHPMYAGAYVYGRTHIDPRRRRPGRPGSGQVRRAPEQWPVLLRDRVPAYISWDQYERQQERLRANRARAEARGAVRHGPSLLAGLLTCSRCGARLTVRYQGRQGRHTYVCNRQRADYGAAPCQQVAGPALDQAVSRQVLAALEPAALEVSLAAAGQVEQERADLRRLWEQRLERATYEAERAGRHYRLVEPENRLVARQLEREWEEKLAVQQRLEEEYRRVGRQQPRLLSEAERATIRRLAADIPRLWAAPTTTDAERKEIIRQVVEWVVVDATAASERMRATICWVGGAQADEEIVRPVARLEQLSYYPQLCDRVRTLAGMGLTAPQIAARLTVEGYRPPKRREQFGAQGIKAVLERLGLHTRQAHPQRLPGLGADEWSLPALARALDMPRVTLYTWVTRGWVRARQTEPPAGRWVLWADTEELKRLRALRQRPAGQEPRQPWATAPPPPPRPPHPSIPATHGERSCDDASR